MTSLKLLGAYLIGLYVLFILPFKFLSTADEATYESTTLELVRCNGEKDTLTLLLHRPTLRLEHEQLFCSKKRLLVSKVVFYRLLDSPLPHPHR